jgi:ceramide glucosyltransferase
MAGAAALLLIDAGFGAVAIGLVGHTVAWLAAEKWFMAGRGLAFGLRAAMAALAREALAPVLMLSALSGRSIDWRGTDLGGQWRTRGDGASGTPV